MVYSTDRKREKKGKKEKKEKKETKKETAGERAILQSSNPNPESAFSLLLAVLMSRGGMCAVAFYRAVALQCTPRAVTPLDH